MSNEKDIGNDFEFSSSVDEKYSRDNVLICRVKPSMMQFVDKFCDGMGMNRSEFLRYCVNKMRYEYAMGMTLQDIKERIAWVNESARKYNMSVERYVSFCLDFMRVLDMSGMLETLVMEMKERREQQATKNGPETVFRNIPGTKGMADATMKRASRIQSDSLKREGYDVDSDADE